MWNASYAQGLDSTQGFPDDQVRAQFFHPGSNLSMTDFRVEIVSTDDASEVRSYELFPQETRDPAVAAPAHAMDVQNGFHLAKIRLIP